MKFDLHCHSDFSDGLLPPKALIDYAVARNITHLALTDHDSVDGLIEAREYIESHNLPLQLINGVEISAMTEFGEIHIVGLGVDHENCELITALEIQQQKRWERAQKITEHLVKLGLDGVFIRCQQLARKVVTRTHIARAMVELEFVTDMQQAFKKYIGKKGRIKVTKDWMEMEDAINLIHSAGGRAVLAHPTRYPLSNRKLSFLIKAFAENRGDAIEMAYPSLNADKIAWLKIQRESSQLLASSGSDFHYPELRWTDLGRFPQLEQSIPHVIQHLI